MQSPQHAALANQNVSAVRLESLGVVQNRQGFLEMLAPDEDVGKPAKNVSIARYPLQDVTILRLRGLPLSCPGEQAAMPATRFEIIGSSLQPLLDEGDCAREVLVADADANFGLPVLGES